MWTVHNFYMWCLGTFQIRNYRQKMSYYQRTCVKSPRNPKATVFVSGSDSAKAFLQPGLLANRFSYLLSGDRLCFNVNTNLGLLLMKHDSFVVPYRVQPLQHRCSCLLSSSQSSLGKWELSSAFFCSVLGLCVDIANWCQVELRPAFYASDACPFTDWRSEWVEIAFLGSERLCEALQAVSGCCWAGCLD